jgi:hypothetical protein
MNAMSIPNRIALVWVAYMLAISKAVRLGEGGGNRPEISRPAKKRTIYAGPLHTHIM